MRHLAKKISLKTRRTNNLQPSYQIVYEWEDCLAEILECKIEHYVKSRYLNMFIRRFEKVLFFLLRKWLYTQVGKFQRPLDMYYLSFEPGAFSNELRCNRPNIIPIIIDFCMKKEEIPLFESLFSRAPFVIVTNREAIDFLNENKCRLKIYHLPLTLPNKYVLVEKGWDVRSYDIIFAGRQNPVLTAYFSEYLKAHSEITFLRPVFENSMVNYYNQDGVLVSSVWNREDYWKVLKMGKMGFYASPGMDGEEYKVKGFSQATPRILEFLAAGCNVITRYSINVDTKYHEYDTYFFNVNSYNDFELEMKRCLNTPPDFERHQEYLDKHYTSTIVPIIEEIFSDHFLSI